MSVKLITVQVKREFWEHRNVFVVIPLICALLMAFFWIAAVMSDPTVNQKDGTGLNLVNPGIENFLVQDDSGAGFKLNFDNKKIIGFIVAVQQFAGWWLFTTISLFLTLYYCSACLFNDRKSRDILFWRSMPVSERTNVLIKLTVAMLSVPVLTLLMNVISSLILLVVLCLWLGNGEQFLSALQAMPLHARYLLGSLGLVPLLLPMLAWTMLASAAAKKSPFLGATFIPIMLLITDRFFNHFLGISLGIYDCIKKYFSDMGDIFEVSFENVENVGVSFAFHYSSDVAVYGLISALMLCAVLWLRNNRYEI